LPWNGWNCKCFSRWCLVHLFPVKRSLILPSLYILYNNLHPPFYRILWSHSNKQFVWKPCSWKSYFQGTKRWSKAQVS
jgi:hypothetical protein